MQHYSRAADKQRINRDPLASISTRRTPQDQPATSAHGSTTIPNAAGGHVFAIGDDARVLRFLTLGTTGGTYYATEQAITRENADVVLGVARTRGTWLVEQIVKVSLGARAPRQQPGLFALAAVAGLGDEPGRKAALTAIPQVCRTASTLFTFAGYVEQFRGWGRGLRRAVAGWYLDREVDDLAYQVVKYRQRAGWTHRDLLRLAHPLPGKDDAGRRLLFDYAVGRRGVDMVDIDGAVPDLPGIVQGFELGKLASTPAAWVGLIGRYPGLSWEMLPDAALGHREVWQALIAAGMPTGALLRQLPRLTRLGVLDQWETRSLVVTQLTHPDGLRKARIHPIAVLIAAKTYASGHSDTGSSTWSPNPDVVDALDAAFYAAYAAVTPTGKRMLIALDVSGSMGNPVSGSPLSCREAGAALALVVKSTEVQADVVGFTAGGLSPWSGKQDRRFSGYGGTAISRLDISPRRRLDDVVAYTAGLGFGGTDCSLPMQWALAHGESYDTFVIITDNETWHGDVHPHQALARYRAQLNPNARLCVMALTATGTSIADPLDPGQLDVSGFDAAVPTLLNDFARGAV